VVWVGGSVGGGWGGLVVGNALNGWPVCVSVGVFGGCLAAGAPRIRGITPPAVAISRAAGAVGGVMGGEGRRNAVPPPPPHTNP